MTQAHPDDWTPLLHTSQNRCFGCGEANPRGLQLTFFRKPDGTVVCPVEMPDLYEGPPGYLHGGIIATLLDEAMSKAVRALGFTAVTRHLEADYRLPVPSLTPLRVEGRHLRSEGRKHFTEAAIIDAEERALVRGKAVFIEVAPR
ncbi:MAG: PaaI family thioesterase [Acidobacteriaceae bacterium]|nr:PaaI family thioesterase [Acidobacteriaceae bacterium]